MLFFAVKKIVMIDIFDIFKIFNRKQAEPLSEVSEVTESETVDIQTVDEPISKGTSSSVSVPLTDLRYRQIMDMMDSIMHPTTVGNNFLELFRTVPEVFWPINYIASRISQAHFDIKRVKDNSLVWCNRINIDSILRQPNPVTTWRELVYQHFVYKLATGNAFLRASLPEHFGPDTLICRMCDNYWELPADKVFVVPMHYSYGIPIFGIAKKEELIQGYKLQIEPYQGLIIPWFQIWHDRDGLPEYLIESKFLKSDSRLMSQKRPIANLIAVYEARNLIYIKRGGLGFIVARKIDETGTVALDPDEKKELEKTVQANYGITEGKLPYSVTDLPVDFVRTNLSISDLQPFDETLADAIQIASVFNIPAVLVPRKDQSTFSNQDAAEKSVYTGTIIPMTKRFCEELTLFLGLEKKGYYIDCDFSDVACLQTGRKDGEQVKSLELDRDLKAFNAGLITLDDIRSHMHQETKADTIPLFGKLKFEMTPEELEIVNKIINIITSKGESNVREDEKPSVGNEGN